MVHAPHSPIPQPYFVPTRLKASRSTHNIGVSGATSTERVRPLTFSVYLLMAVRESKGGTTEPTLYAPLERPVSQDEGSAECSGHFTKWSFLSSATNRGSVLSESNIASWPSHANSCESPS